MIKKKKREQSLTARFLKTSLHFLLITVFLAGMAILLTWFLQYKYYDSNADLTWQFFLDHVEIFWYGALVIFVILSFCSAVTGRPFIVAGIFWIATIILSFANINKLRARDEPLLPEDIQMAGNADTLTQFVDIDELRKIIIASILILVLSILLNFLAHKIWKFDKDLPWWRRHAIVQRLLLSLVLGFASVQLVKIVYDTTNPKHESLIEKIKLDPIIYNQRIAYKNNGFLMGFLANCGKVTVEKPENYNEKTIKELAEKYIKKSNAFAQPNIAEVADNIVIVLAESFYDPSLLDEYLQHQGGDVTPNLHRIMEKYPSGYMYTTVYGGGTANVEAEIFSGLTNYWANKTIYSEIFTKQDAIPSVATFTRDKFDTKVIHSYSGTLYKRGMALQKQGFSDFITEERMNYTQAENGQGYISDREIYQEGLDMIKNKDGKQTIGLITMQNHAPYDLASYPELNFKLAVDDEDSQIIEAYYQSLHYSDQYLGEFINELDSLDEKTVVLWFGDHSGGVYSKLRDSSEEIVDLTQQVPYFVYANFELNEGHEKLPTTTPNCLVNTMYNVLEVKKPTMGYLLDEVCKTNPILTSIYLRDKEPIYDAALRNYQLLNYDIMVGKQYWLKYAKY